METSPASYPRGESLAAAAERVIPGGVNSTTRYIGRPYAFGTGDGAYLTDLDGHRYLDYHAAFGAMLLGHNFGEVDDAVRATIGGPVLSGLGVSELEVALAEKVTALIPSADSMLLTMSGSEATAQAIRLARAATGRKLIIKFQGGFHGWHDAVARNVISPADRAYDLDPLSQGILASALEATLIAEFNDLDSVQRLYDEHPGQIAGIILEPIPHNVGALVPTQEFVAGLRRLTTDTGSVLIFDEVITGFRHDLGGYQQILQITPDLTTFGKGMANGYPIGGVAGSQALMEHFRRGGDVLVAGTFNGNPVGCAAALATIDYLERHPDFYTRTRALGERLRSGLQKIATELGLPARAAGYGGVFALYFTADRPAGYRDLLDNDNDAYLQFHRRMTDRGFLMLPLALKRNHVSGSHTADDVEQTLAAAEQVLAGIAAESDRSVPVKGSVH